MSFGSREGLKVILKLNTFEKVLHYINQIKDSTLLELIYKNSFDKISLINANYTLNSISNNRIKIIDEFYLLAEYMMEKKKNRIH